MRKIFFSIVSFLVLVGCQNELYKDAANDFQSGQGVYISNKGVLQYFVEENETSEIKDLKICLAQKTEQQVKISLEAGSQAQLDEYNRKNGTNYVLLPEQMYDLSSAATFQPLFTTVVVPVHMKNIQFSPKGTYALPIKISGGDVAMIGGQTETLIVFEQRVVTKALRFNGSGCEDANMFPSDFKVPQWTMEIMINRKNFDSNNKAICGTKTVDGAPIADEIYPRFGDVTINMNQIQLKTGGAQIDVKSFSAAENTWYMLSFVYDGKNTMIYVNGSLVAQQEIRTGSYGLTGFWIDGWNELLREVRFYKIARTAQQIASSVWKTVDYNDDNLLLYYPMNGKKYDRTSGTVVDDETKIWDWSKSQKHFDIPSGAIFDTNGGKNFVFPPVVQ